MGILTHIKDLTLGDRPEMKFTSGLGLKVILIQQRRGGDQKKSQFKIIHRKQPQGKQYDTGTPNANVPRKTQRQSPGLINQEVTGVA